MLYRLYGDHWQRSRRSSSRTGKPFTWRRAAENQSIQIKGKVREAL